MYCICMHVYCYIVYICVFISYLFYNVYVHNQHTEMELSFDENVATAPLDENSDIYKWHNFP